MKASLSSPLTLDAHVGGSKLHHLAARSVCWRIQQGLNLLDHWCLAHGSWVLMGQRTNGNGQVMSRSHHALGDG